MRVALISGASTGIGEACATLPWLLPDRVVDMVLPRVLADSPLAD